MIGDDMISLFHGIPSYDTVGVARTAPADLPFLLLQSFVASQAKSMV